MKDFSSIFQTKDNSVAEGQRMIRPIPPSYTQLEEKGTQIPQGKSEQMKFVQFICE